MSELEEFFDDIPTDGEDPFADTEEKDTPADSSPETKPETEESPSQEGETEDTEPESGEESEDNTPDEPVPFHKHPKWAEIYNQNKELKSTVEDLQTQMTQRQQIQQEMQRPTSVPDWFRRLYGDDQETYRLYQQDQVNNRQSIKDEIRREFQEEQQQVVQQQKQWEDWVESELNIMKADGLKFDRNRLIKIALDYQPSDQNGNIDLRKAHQIMMMQEGKKDTEQIKARKKVANVTGSKKATSSKSTVTASSIRKKDWHDY